LPFIYFSGEPTNFVFKLASLVEESHFGKAADIFNQECQDTLDKEDLIKMLGLKNANSKQLQYAIGFAHGVHVNLQPRVYKELYQNLKLNKFTRKPEMLLLQSYLRLEKDPGAVLADVKNLVDKDCQQIISSIVKGVENNDNSISIYIVDSIDSALLNENMETIVKEFYTGTVPQIVKLFNYLKGLPISTDCFLIAALLREVEKKHSLESEEAMFIWAYAMYIIEEQLDWPLAAPSDQKLCTDVFKKLSAYKDKYFQKYQAFIENPNTHILKDEYSSTNYLSSMVRKFVSFYYNQDEGERAKNLVDAADLTRNIYKVGQILSQTHLEMGKKKQLSTFQAFRLQNCVKKILSRQCSTSECHHWKYPFEHLKNKAPACVRQLLYSDRPFECFLVNGKHSSTVLTASTLSGAR
jgi:hypothetical protein